MILGGERRRRGGATKQPGRDSVDGAKKRLSFRGSRTKRLLGARAKCTSLAATATSARFLFRAPVVSIFHRRVPRNTSPNFRLHWPRQASLHRRRGLDCLMKFRCVVFGSRRTIQATGFASEQYDPATIHSSCIGALGSFSRLQIDGTQLWKQEGCCSLFLSPSSSFSRRRCALYPLLCQK